MARPTVFTKNVLQKLEYAFSLGCTDEEACIYAKIAPSSLYNYQKENTEFLERKRLLRHTPILKARMEVIEGFKGNPNLALRYLERKKSDEFSLHSTTSVEIVPENDKGLLSHPEMQKQFRIMDETLKKLALGKPPQQ